MKKLLSLVLSLALAFSLCVPAMAASESMANFQKTATYNNQFSDVSASYWATPSIKLCYEYGFMKGTTPKQFSPTGALTVAEAIVMADRLHEIYTTGQSTLTNGEPWYQTYVDYALENGIVQAGDFTSYTAKATRGQMAYLFSRALPASVLPSINNVQTLPDVTGSTKYSQEIFSLYNAGVLTGSDVFGTFKPNDNIIRAEAAAILTRVALPEQRKTVVLMKQVQWGVAKLAIPQSAGAGVTENGMYTVTSEQDACGVIATSVTDSAYKGLSVTVLTEQQMNNILTQAFNSTDGKLSNAKSTKVSFGSVKAYRTVGILTTDEGAGDCLIFTYITGNKMDMICLLAYENDTALKNMANGLMVGGVTAKEVTASTSTGTTNSNTGTTNNNTSNSNNTTKPNTGNSTSTGNTGSSSTGSGSNTTVTKPIQNTVYVTPTGKRYHYSKDCAGKNGKATTLQNAKARGLTPCAKCVG